MQNEFTKPTHILHVAVPLDLSDPHPKFDVVQDALRGVMFISRAAYERYICDAVLVSIEEVK